MIAITTNSLDQREPRPNSPAWQRSYDTQGAKYHVPSLASSSGATSRHLPNRTPAWIAGGGIFGFMEAHRLVELIRYIAEPEELDRVPARSGATPSLGHDYCGTKYHPRRTHERTQLSNALRCIDVSAARDCVLALCVLGIHELMKSTSRRLRILKA